MTTTDLQRLATHADLYTLKAELSAKIDSVFQAVKDLKSDLIRASPRSGNSEPRQFYTPREFADLVGVSKNTIIRRCQDGTYQSTQPGGCGTAILIPCSELDRIKKRAEDLA